jgi:aspartate aminotransferase
MISEKMIGLVQGSSVIRAMFEEGKKMAEQYGAENVFDFSLGNPNVPAPDRVNEIMKEIIEEEPFNVLHGYMSNAGYEEVRDVIANSLNERFGMTLNQSNILMTVGAAGGLNVILKALINPGDEVIVFAPFFGEYRSYASNYDAKLVVVPANTEDFQLNLAALPDLITEKTKAVIINNPNNPTGVVYSEEKIQALAKILEEKEAELSTSIYLISDEPYRELVYDGVQVPYIPKYYHNTIVGYSYSKSLSLPGERIGYLVIPDTVTDCEDVKGAANVANRILGFVNAPSLLQKTIARCIQENVTTDVTPYDRNRELLYNGLKNLGFECIKPEGAFYLFVKSPMEDEKEFVAAAKKYQILMVQGSAFACPGYVRLAYCVSEDTIKNSMPGFEKLAKEIFGE